MQLGINDPLSLTEQMAENRRAFNRGKSSVEGDPLGCTLDHTNRPVPSLPKGGLFDSDDEDNPESPANTPADVLLRSLPEVVRVDHMLGIGSFGCVYRCVVVLPDGRQVDAAVKTFTASKVSLGEYRETESMVLAGLCHPNVVRLYTVISAPMMKGLILELCSGGTLQSMIHRVEGHDAFMALTLRGRLSAPLDVARALEYLHANAVVHRDVKSGNCFFRDSMSTVDGALPLLKLGDLGSAKQMISVAGGMTQCVGTVRYMAPEVVTSSSYGFEADVFSLGILMHEVVSGQVPFGLNGRMSKEAALAAIVAGERPSLDGLPGDERGVLHDLMSASWCGNPARRPKAGDLMQQLDAVITVI